MNRYIRRSTESGAIVIVEQRLNLSDCASYRKPEISMVSVPRSLTLADARELAAALTQAVEQAEAWEQPRDGDEGE